MPTAAMTGSRTELIAARLMEPLRGVIGAVAAVGVLSALMIEPAPAEQGADRAGALPSPVLAVPAGPGAPAPQDPGAPLEAESAPVPEDPAAPVALGPSVVPVPGVYRYQVRSTTDGVPVVQEERREVEQLAGDRTAGSVRITARLEGESQVSVLDWSPQGAVVRTTRIESGADQGRDCTWSPPFAEFGPLEPGSTWSLDSECRTPVAGIDTVFEVSGSGRVVGRATIDSGGTPVPVWHVERDRITTITALLAGDRLVQTVREQGSLFLDPARGVVVRSDVTITLDGAQRGVTTRTSVLQPG